MTNRITRWVFLSMMSVALGAQAEETSNVVRLATTTTTTDSGLMKFLLPRFEKSTGYKVQLLSVGSGTALRMGRNGQADALLVHAPEAEQDFIADGHGINRHPVMHNHFCLVGPEDDPAAIRSLTSVLEAMKKIQQRHKLFISRGDDSGTHIKEQTLWQQAEIDPIGMPWYSETGQSMGKTLDLASQLQAYTLTDAGTWLAKNESLALSSFLCNDLLLKNPYHVIVINPDKHPEINHKGANAFVSWLISADTQKMIDLFRIKDKPLFIPEWKE